MNPKTTVHKKITEGTVYIIGNQVQQLDILAGPSHNKLETCAQYEGPAQPGFHLVFECPSIVRGRYVKIQRTDASLLSLAEVRVMAFVEKSDN